MYKYTYVYIYSIRIYLGELEKGHCTTSLQMIGINHLKMTQRF